MTLALALAAGILIGFGLACVVLQLLAIARDEPQPTISFHAPVPLSDYDAEKIREYLLETYCNRVRASSSA